MFTIAIVDFRINIVLLSGRKKRNGLKNDRKIGENRKENEGDQFLNRS